MSLPEISRRCLACGASVRVGARFCPQCGTALAAEESAPGAEAGPGGKARRPDEPETGRRGEAGPGWVAPAPLTRPATDEASSEGQRGLKATREFESPAAGPAPATRDVFSPPRDPAPPESAALRTTRESSPPSFAGGAPVSPGASGGRARAETAGETVRMRGAAARVRETVMPRVERMREEALVVLEETPDDSGLRFVLIAVVLFGLFLLFLLLSTTVLR